MTGRQGQYHNINRDTECGADIALRKVLVLIIVVCALVALTPGFLRAQENLLAAPPETTSTETVELSGIEPEDAVQPSGMEVEEPGIGPLESLNLSGGEGEEAVIPETGEEGFELPPIEIPAFEEIYDLSPAQVESAIFSLRPTDPYYTEVVSRAPAPDITLLGPVPTVSAADIEFTDIAADWIYYQKSAGLTELRGHVMIIYETTIISCDEATLDEKNEIYRFFGEGRVFVDDADFTLECDELEIQDAEGVKMIYITGQSTMVVYADEDAEPPAEDARRRDRVMYALKQQDSIITFNNAEYDYENDIFDAHGGVRFEQPDKYAVGDEFHGENETEYMHFTGNCEFWQEDGQWLYEYQIIEDQEDPPSRSDRITRALMAVASTVTCDEAEGRGDSGWLEMRSYDGNVVYFHQDDKHAECETFTLWYSGERDDEEEEGEPEEEEDVWEQPRGFGQPRLASDYPPGYVPWIPGANPFPDETPVSVQESTQPEEEIIQDDNIVDNPDISTYGGDVPAIMESADSGESELDVVPAVDEGGPSDESIPIDLNSITESALPGVTLEGMGPIAGGPAGSQEWTPPTSGDEGDVELQEPPGSLSELPEDVGEILTAEPTTEEDIEGPRNEVIMQGNVLIRQENGDWLFTYDVVREEEESEESIEQYRKWANASCDYLHIWTRDEIVEATGTVFGEQDNQDLACDFLRYLGKLDMVYLRGNILVHREGKHQLMSNEAFMFLSTNVFEALGQVQTTVTVDVEERRDQAQEGTSEEGTEETPAEGAPEETGPEVSPEETPPEGETQ